MRLKTFTVKNYKVIDDTEEVPVDEKVTALVGKNESGKTAILRALWKSKNVAGARFDKLFDYPRDRYSRDRKKTQEVSVLEFELNDEEHLELAGVLSEEPLKAAETVSYTTSYVGEDDIKTEVSFGENVEKLCFRPAKDGMDAVEAVFNAIDSASVADDALAKSKDACMKGVDASGYLWNEETINALEEFGTAIETWLKSDTGTRDAIAKNERAAFAVVLAKAKEGNPLTPAQEWFTKRMPAFIYFDDYGQLETKIHLPTFIRTKDDPNDRRVRTQMALFEWSGLDPEEILQLGKPSEGETPDQGHRRLEKRRALLDSASFSLTGDWVEWWDDREHTLHFDVDGEDLVLRVSDPRNPFPMAFEERSHGFRWFFSFYLVFLVESEKAHENTVLLLDEPGLHLHPTLQTKLIAFFERIADGGNSLIYSTHLPFLVDGDHLERVRTVHLFGSEPQKTKVSNDVRPSGDRDTLFPLQAAVGYSIAQTLFIGKRSVIVEGITDYWLMKSLSDVLSGIEGYTSLDAETVLIPAGGTSKLMPLASIMFSTTGVHERKLRVLLDSDREGLQAKKRVEDLFGDDSSLLMLGNAISRAEATIEDLLPQDEYVRAVAAAVGKEVTLNADEKKEVTNVGTLKKSWQRHGWGEFGTEQKSRVALHLIGEWGGSSISISDECKKRASALFTHINSSFE